MIATTAAQDQVQLRLLKVFAEMCAFCDVLDNATQRIDNIYQVLRVSVPLIFVFRVLNILFSFIRSICPYPN